MTLPRVDFNVPFFNDLIQQKGYRLMWEKALRCPCIDVATGRAVEGCPQCDARGYWYFGATEIKGIITRQNKELQIGDAIGVLEPGNAYLTTEPTNKLAKWDRVTNLDSQMLMHETVVKDAEDDDYLTYPPVSAVEMAVCQPTRLSNILVLTQGTDFTIDAAGKITWLMPVETKPKANTGISFRYYHHPLWLVTDSLNAVRDTFIKGMNSDVATQMPVRVQIRLETFGKASVNNQ